MCAVVKKLSFPKNTTTRDHITMGKLTAKAAQYKAFMDEIQQDKKAAAAEERVAARAAATTTADAHDTTPPPP